VYAYGSVSVCMLVIPGLSTGHLRQYVQPRELEHSPPESADTFKVLEISYVTLASSVNLRVSAARVMEKYRQYHIIFNRILMTGLWLFLSN
jgi:hypothetical protein